MQDPEKLSQLLRQRAGTENYSFPFTTATSQGTHGAIATPAQSPQLPAAPQQQVHVVPPLRAPPLPPPSKRVKASSRHVKPKLETHHSAPTTSEVVGQNQDLNKMYHSFHGGHAVGDTQPDSQIYRDFTSRVHESSTHESENGGSRLDQINEEDEIGITERPEMVALSPAAQNSPAITSPAILRDENDEESQPQTSPFKISTPAMAGRKRNIQGNILSSGARTVTTPGTAITTSAFFNADMGTATGKGLSLTQVFDATQAAGTSPFVGAPNADAVFQRPSPNFTHARRSSPIPESSPTAHVHIPSSIRSSSEPRAEYITMKQSQERRLRENVQVQSEPPEQDRWEDSVAVQKQAAGRKARERFEKETAESFKKVTALRSSPMRRGGRHLLLVSASKKNQTPSRRKARQSAYDGPFDDDELEDPAPTRASGGIRGGGLQNEVASSPVRTGSRGENEVEVPRTSSHPHGTLSGRPSRHSPPGSLTAQVDHVTQSQSAAPQAVRREAVVKTKNSVTVFNSQPDDPDFEDISRPPPLVLPSSPSTNQYSINQTTMRMATGFTSQLVSSSLPPKPPESSSPRQIEKDHEKADADEEERVPSSPPAVDAGDAEDEDEVLYDEHNYDEHVSAGEEVEEAGLPPVEDDEGVAESQYDEGDDHEEQENEEIDGDEAVENVSGAGGDEVPETAEHDDALDADEETTDRQNEAVPNSFEESHQQRQSTVPESDMMEDTQPSNFAQTNTGDTQSGESKAHDDATPKQVPGTGPYHTAQEQQSPSKSTGDNTDNSYSTPMQAPRSEKRSHFRSLNDIANQTETQSSFDIANIEIPNIFGVDAEGDVSMSGSSPLKRSTKKRKITYTAKKTLEDPRSPTKSPIAVMKQTASSPIPQPSEPSQEAAPSSTLEREEAGASAAAKARAKIMAAKAPSSKEETSAQPSRRSKRKGISKTEKGKPAPQKPKRATRAARNEATEEAERAPSAAVEDPDVEMPDVEEDVHDPAGVPDKAAEPLQPAERSNRADRGTPVNDNVSDRGEDPTGELICPERVLAYWPGQGYYYPATCLGNTGVHQVKVRYDEGTENTLDVGQVRLFDLRIGDQIKVDQPGMKKHVYVVAGLKDKIKASSAEEYPLTDRHGYQTVILEVKQRESILPSDRPREPETIAVPVANVYLTSQLSGKFRDRYYKSTPSPSPAASTSRLSTPVATAANGVISPTLSRRGTAGPSMLRESIVAGSVTSTCPAPASTVFQNMAFAITLQHDEDEYEKRALSKLITSNGGQVLDGFYELFDDTDEVDAPSRPTSSAGKTKGKGKSSRSSFGSTTSANTGLTLKDVFKNLHFAALITDTHSRRTKYIQALALNIPCLHQRWLNDSIAASNPLPFTKYLLPAGLSTFLSPEGVVRSRSLQLYNPVDAIFSDIVESRDLLLKDYSVLLITGKSKREIERKKPYLFLTHALGPHTVGRCSDIFAAWDMLKSGTWDWVYVDGGVAGLSEAEKAFFDTGGEKSKAGSAAPARGKKRKSFKEASVEPEVLVKVGEVGGRKVRLVCDEFVIQSLILGALVEE